MPVSKDCFGTNSNAWKCLVIRRHLFGENVKVLNYFGYFLKRTFYPGNNFYFILMMLQISKTKPFLNLAENVLLCNFKTVKFSQIFLKHFKIT